MFHILIYVLAALSVCILLFGVYFGVCSWRDDYLERQAAKRERRAATIIADRINRAHWEFTDNPEVFNALFFTQYMLKKYGHMNADTIRNLVNTFGEKRYCDMPEEELEGWLP